MKVYPGSSQSMLPKINVPVAKFDTSVASTVSSEKIALVYFLRFLAFSLERKIKIRNDLCCHFKYVAGTPIRKVKNRKNRFSVNSQNLRYTIFCECTVSLLLYLLALRYTRKVVGNIYYHYKPLVWQLCELNGQQ